MAAKETCSSGFLGKSTSVVAASGDEDPAISNARSGAGVSIESSYMHCLQQQHNNNKGMPNMMSPQPPPPVAMSLRARETSSMALKHIFDQIKNSGSSLAAATTRGGEDWKSSQGQSMGGFQGIRNQSLPDLRKRLPDLDLSFRKAQAGQENSPAMAPQTGFGSPISMPTATNQSLLSQAALPSWSPMNGQLQQSFLPQAAASPRPNPSSRKSTAQLTIFYSGNVNVYDDVPADKAHAIMLLAGNSWTSNFRSPAPPVEKESAPSPLRAGAPPASPTPNITISNNTASSASRGSFSSPAPSLSLTTPPPSPALTPAPLEGKPQGAAKRPHAGIELPHARKASLARFLEKRKDRVQVQQVNPEAVEKGGGEPSSRPPSPTSSSKKQCTGTRSRSPSPPKSKANAYSIEQNNPSHINEHRFLD